MKRRILCFIFSLLMLLNVILPMQRVVGENVDSVKKIEEQIDEDNKKIKKDKLKNALKDQKNRNLENSKVEEENENTDKKNKINKKNEIIDKKFQNKKKNALYGDLSDKEKIITENLKRRNLLGATLNGVPQERNQTKIKTVEVISTENEDPIVGHIKVTQHFRIKMLWDASIYQNQLRPGDYFTVKLPKELRFSRQPMVTSFNVFTPDGNNVVAVATLTSKGYGGGGEVKVVFNNYVENKYNIKGNLYLEAAFIKEKVIVNQVNDFELSIGTNVKTIHIHIDNEPTEEITNEILAKWGTDVEGQPEKAEWSMRINFNKNTYQNAVITDQLFTDDGNLLGVVYDTNSFKLYKVKYNKYGNYIVPPGKIPVNISGKLRFNSEKTSFELDLGNINGEQYYLEYQTTYVPRMQLKNRATLKAQTVKQITIEGFYQSFDAGGTGVGDNLGKIKIIKVSSENPNLKLKGAKFRITRKATGTSFDLVTGDNGEIVSNFLIPGEYDIKEIEPPKGFLLNGTTYTVIVKKGEVVLQTITNAPEKTSVKVTKTWIGPVKEVTIRLYKTVGGV